MTLEIKRCFALVTLILTVWLGYTRPLRAATENHEPERCADGSVQLAGGPNEFEGHVELCREGAWGHVCGYANPEVVCRQLISPAVIPENSTDYSTYVSNVTPQPGSVKRPFAVENLVCNGTESKLTDCSFNIRNDSSGCTNEVYTYVLCQDPVCFENPESVRLVPDAYEAATLGHRIEVCHHGNQLRRGVCDTNWDDIDALIVCKELNRLPKDIGPNGFHPKATFSHDARYIGSALDNVSCAGIEQKVSHCDRNDTNRNPSCKFAGVICQDQSTMTSLPLATSRSLSFSPVPSTSIKATVGPELGSSSESSLLLQTSRKTSYTASPHLNMKTVSGLSTITLHSSPQPSSTSAASTVEITLPGGVPANKTVTTIGIAFGVVGGLLVLVVVVLVVILLAVVGRKQKKFPLSESLASNGGPSPRYTQNDRVATQHNGSSDNEETERMFLNSLYTKTTLLPPNEYATLEESIGGSQRSATEYPENSPYYSTPTTVVASQNSDNRLTRSGPGFTTPVPDHLYDDTIPNTSVSNGTSNASSNCIGVLNDHLYEQPPLSELDMDCHNNDTTDPHLYAVLESSK